MSGPFIPESWFRGFHSPSSSYMWVLEPWHTPLAGPTMHTPYILALLRQVALEPWALSIHWSRFPRIEPWSVARGGMLPSPTLGLCVLGPRLVSYGVLTTTYVCDGCDVFVSLASGPTWEWPYLGLLLASRVGLHRS